jgi:hypothetical protein
MRVLKSILLLKDDMGVGGKGLEEAGEIEAAVVVEAEFEETLGVGGAAIACGLDMGGIKSLIVQKDFTHPLKGKRAHIERGKMDMYLFEALVLLE